jgi:hypothetical protein
LNDLQARNAARWLSATALVWSFVVTRVDSRWGEVMVFAAHEPIALPGSILDGVPYGAYGHDWRAQPRQAWMEMFAERELSEAVDVRELPGRTSVSLVALAEDDFRDAVRAALKELHRDDALARNPLVRSRAVRDAGGKADAAALRHLIRQAVTAIEAHPRDEKLARAVEATYLDPAETQELAAERLDLPFSTYRRHLTSGIERVADWLWQRELGGT